MMTSVQQQPVSSGGGDERCGKLEERKRKRKMSNRESARRSGMKKQQEVDELMKQVEQLRKQKKMMVEKTEEATDVFVAVASENNILRAQLLELTDRLCSFNSVLHIVEEVSGFPMDIPELPQTLMEPWQLPCPIITSYANVFHC